MRVIYRDDVLDYVYNTYDMIEAAEGIACLSQIDSGVIYNVLMKIHEKRIVKNLILKQQKQKKASRLIIEKLRKRFQIKKEKHYSYREYPSHTYRPATHYDDGFEENVRDFISICQQAANSDSDEYYYKIFDMLVCKFGMTASSALAFFIEQSDMNTIEEFAKRYMSSYYASVDIIVKPVLDIMQMRGNTGLFVICTRKVDKERQLYFTHQASAVYYLMSLIDRYHRHGTLPPMRLEHNVPFFQRIYSKVYPLVSQTEIEAKTHDLLYREDNGRTRKGRENDIVYDIRKHLEEHFKDYGESCDPYAMSAKRHLTISQSHIMFVGAANSLLNLWNEQ